MKKLLSILAQAWSILLYPIWMPTIGTCLLAWAVQHSSAAVANTFWGLHIANTAILTIVFPMTFLLLSIRRGHIKDIYVSDHTERTPLYIFTCCCYGIWCMSEFNKLPNFFIISIIGATAALAIVTLINMRWKISAHLCGLGGLIGGIISFYAHASMFPPMGGLIMLLACALLLMYARIYLRAHTDKQVVAGFLLGITSTLLPNIIICYVQTI